VALAVDGRRTDVQPPAGEHAVTQGQLIAVADAEAENVALGHVWTGHVGLTREQLVEAARRVIA
jgi:hypothetical protein